MEKQNRLASFFGAQDMTQGSPWKNLIQFSVPLLIGNIAQQLYSTVDAIIVGNYIGDHAIGAIGATFPILNLLLVLFIGISTGAGIMVSQYYGAKKKEQLSYTVGTAITLGTAIAIFVAVLGALIARPALSLLNTPPEIYEDACSYLTISFIFILGSAYYNMLSGVLRGLGDSITPLIYLVVACVVNIILDIVFVATFKMGVAGVAYATVISQTISGVLCLIKVLRMKDVLVVDKAALKPHKELTKQMIRLGLPSGVTQAIFSLAMITVQSLTNGFGAVMVAANTIVMRVDGFAMMPNFTFGIAMTTYAGQNIGARKLDRVVAGTRVGLILGIGVSAVMTIAILFFGRAMMSWFNPSPEAMELGWRMMRIIAVGYIAMAATQILSGIMRGAGDTMTPMWISMITTVGLRVPIAYLYAYFTRTGEALSTGSPDSIFVSMLISWLMGALITALFFKRGRWRKKGLIDG